MTSGDYMDLNVDLTQKVIYEGCSFFFSELSTAVYRLSLRFVAFKVWVVGVGGEKAGNVIWGHVRLSIVFS